MSLFLAILISLEVHAESKIKLCFGEDAKIETTLQYIEKLDSQASSFEASVRQTLPEMKVMPGHCEVSQLYGLSRGMTLILNAREDIPRMEVAMTTSWSYIKSVWHCIGQGQKERVKDLFLTLKRKIGTSSRDGIQESVARLKREAGQFIHQCDIATMPDDELKTGPVILGSGLLGAGSLLGQK